MDSYVDIQPASAAQVRRAREGGAMVVVDDDVQGVARDLRELGAFSLHFDPYEDIWVVTQEVDGEEHLVTTAQECDQRIVRRVREVTAPGYDLHAEMEKADRAAAAHREQQMTAQHAEKTERLAHALAKDLGHGVKASVPRGV